MSPTRYVIVESVSTALCGKTANTTLADEPDKSQASVQTWCGRRDSNPHSEELVPKTSASANSATPARVLILRAPAKRPRSRTLDWSHESLLPGRRIRR